MKELDGRTRANLDVGSKRPAINYPTGASCISEENCSDLMSRVRKAETPRRRQPRARSSRSLSGRRATRQLEGSSSAGALPPLAASHAWSRHIDISQHNPHVAGCSRIAIARSLVHRTSATPLWCCCDGTMLLPVHCGKRLICNEKPLAKSGSEPTFIALSANFWAPIAESYFAPACQRRERHAAQRQSFISLSF